MILHKPPQSLQNESDRSKAPAEDTNMVTEFKANSEWGQGGDRNKIENY